MKNKKYLIVSILISCIIFTALLAAEVTVYQSIRDNKKDILIEDYEQVELGIQAFINTNNNIMRGLVAYLQTEENRYDNDIQDFLNVLFNDSLHNIMTIDVHDEAYTYDLPGEADSLKANLFFEDDVFILYSPIINDDEYLGYILSSVNNEPFITLIDEFVDKHGIQLSITSNDQVIYGERFEYAPNNMTYDINTLVTDWHVHIQYADNWMPFNYWFILLPFVFLMFSALIGFKIYQLKDNKTKSGFYDSLTGLYNRFYLYHYSEKFLNVGKLNHYNIGVILIDLDDFQKINDDFGHLVGDGILKVFADNLKEQMDSNQKCFRVGGDEFAIILENIESKEAMDQIILKLHDSLKEAFVLYEDFVTISFASGVAIYPDDGDNLDTLFQHAHRAMKDI